MLNGLSVLVTGGTGSFGRAFVERVLAAYPGIKRLVVFSRDELKQYEMSQVLSTREHPALRYFIGDVRDFYRLQRAFEGIDVVVHAAALKQVPAAEYNPFECIKTNVLGAQNVIDAALENDVGCVIALSTDKAAAPINLYGATKLCADKLFTAANNIRGQRSIRFAVVRYGNVLGSRGSVVPFFMQRRSSGILPITDPNMTRFNICLHEGVDMVLWSIENARGGEVFVPRIPSYRIVDLAAAIGPDCRMETVGVRPGEKLHEEMITASDSINTLDLGSYYAILPAGEDGAVAKYWCERGATPVQQGFAYNSGSNTDWLSVDDLRSLIRQHVDPSV